MVLKPGSTVWYGAVLRGDDGTLTIGTATNDEIAKLSLVTEDVSKVASHATTVTGNAAQLSTLFAATVGGPMVKLASLSYGVRKAIAGKKTPTTTKRKAK